MRKFFKPWRRKIGVVALVAALALFGGWIRSQFFLESLLLTQGGQQEEWLGSWDGYIVWNESFNFSGVDNPLFKTYHSTRHAGQLFGSTFIDWKWWF